MSKQEEVSGVMVATCLALAAIFSLWWGWVFATLWGWFAVPLGGPPIGVFHAIGLSAILLLLRTEKPDNSSLTWGWIRRLTVSAISRPATAITIGAVAHWFYA